VGEKEGDQRERYQKTVRALDVSSREK